MESLEIWEDFDDRSPLRAVELKFAEAEELKLKSEFADAIADHFDAKLIALETPSETDPKFYIALAFKPEGPKHYYRSHLLDLKELEITHIVIECIRKSEYPITVSEIKVGNFFIKRSYQLSPYGVVLESATAEFLDQVEIDELSESISKCQVVEQKPLLLDHFMIED